MSQLRQIAQPIAKPPPNNWRLDWSDFVRVVLDLTIQAYQVMRQTGIAQREWNEDTFTVNLEKHLQPLGLDRDLPILVRSLQKQYTPKMKMGKETTKKAKEIDLMLFGVWEKYDEQHFVWEAKRLGDRRINSQYSTLNSEYVNEGMYRFIRHQYAGALNSAGMLGYILAGNAKTIVDDINQSMGNLRKNPALPASNHLIVDEAINQFHDIYQSQHIRTDGTSIKLHHLFLTFDYPER